MPTAEIIAAGTIISPISILSLQIHFIFLLYRFSSRNPCIVYLFRINKRRQDLVCRFKAEEIKLYLENPWVNSIER